MVTIDRVLCPVDFSDVSRHTLGYAAAFALWYDAKVTVLHVYIAPVPPVAVSQYPGNVDLLLLGSTTHHVIREAGVPVLTLRAAVQ